MLDDLASFLSRQTPRANEEVVWGGAWLAFHVTSEQIDTAVDVLQRYRVAFEGPVEYPAPCLIARAIYLKDPSSNFLELSCAR